MNGITRRGCSELNGGLQKDIFISSPREPMNVTLFGKRIFSGVIKDLNMRSPWFIQMGPKPSDKCPYRDKRGGHTDRRGDGHVKRDWNHSATSQGMPETTRNGKRWRRMLSKAFRRSVALSTPRFCISGFQKNERVNFCFKTSSLW